MRTRIITAIIALCVFAPICVFSDTLVLPAAAAVMGCIAVWETWHCVCSGRGEEAQKYGALGHPLLYLPAYLVTACSIFYAYFAMNFCEVASDLENGAAMQVICVLTGSMFVLLFYLFGIAVFSKGKISVEAIAVFFMMTVYVAGSFTCIILLRHTTHGVYLFLLSFLGPWISDTFAYFTGRFFGKHKLIPEVSPKKTVEGCIGGIVFAALSFVLFGWFVRTETLEPNYIFLAIFGAVVSVLGQIGDLIASVVKRHYNIKDYGNLFPGHGGVLDRFDSVLAAAPILYILTALFAEKLF